METLLCDDDFVGIIRDLVVSSGRATSKDFDLSSSSIVPAVRDHELKHVNKTVSGKRLDDNKIIIDRTYSGEGLDVAKPVVATSYFNTIVTA